jgi:hypothetical protein
MMMESLLKKAVVKLDFTHSALPSPIFYSLKFGAGDTVYMKDYITSQADSLMYAIITKQERSKIDSLIENMNLSALDTSYESHVIDGDVYHVTISKNDTLKTIYIHGSNTPDELTALTNLLTELKTKPETTFT